jgi:hypothetical protein
MSDTFTAAKKQYYDNFMQYELTGEQSYKTAYEGALTSMKNTISAIQNQVDTMPAGTVSTSPLPSFSEAERLKEEAKLRASVTPVSVTPTPSMETKYITIGVLGGLTLLLSLL